MYFIVHAYLYDKTYNNRTSIRFTYYYYTTGELTTVNDVRMENYVVGSRARVSIQPGISERSSFRPL